MVRVMRRFAAMAGFLAVLVVPAGPALRGADPRPSCCGTRCRCERGITVARCGCGQSPVSATAAPVASSQAILAAPPSAAHRETSPTAVSTHVAALFDGVPAPPDPPPRLARSIRAFVSRPGSSGRSPHESSLEC